MPRHKIDASGKNTCILRDGIYNTIIVVPLDAQGIMPGHDRTGNQCVFL